MLRLISTLNHHAAKAILCSAAIFSSAASFGQAWEAVGDPTGISAGQVTDISIFAKGGKGNPDTIYVAYKDVANANGITVQKWDGTSWSTIGSAGFVTSVRSPRLVVSGNVPYVAYGNGANMYKMNVKSYNGSSWTAVGSPDFSGGASDHISFIGRTPGAPSTLGFFFVGFADGANGNKATFMKYDGSSWTPLGAPQGNGASATSLTQSSNGDVYAISTESTLSDAPNPIQYTTLASSWVALGSNPLSGGAAFPQIKSNGVKTYGVFSDYGNTKSLAVSDCNTAGAGSWAAPVTYTTDGEADNISMTLEGSGSTTRPVVAYTKASSTKVNVLKFDGTAWSHVGPADLSPGAAGYTGIAVNDGGDYFVAFDDATHGSKLVVMKFFNPNAVPNVPANTTAINVYPNPNTGSFTIKSNNAGIYNIVNVIGQTVKTTELNVSNNYSATISGLNSGIYFVKGNNGINQKVVVTQ